MFVFIMLLYEEIATESRNRAAAIGGAFGLCSGVTAVVAGGPVGGEGQVVFAHGIVVVPLILAIIPAGGEVASPESGTIWLEIFPSSRK